MKSMVIYQSNTGFTKQYAEWIAQALNCPFKSLKEVTPQELSGLDALIFGGWIMGNNIMGLNNMKKKANPNVVFAVGASEKDAKLEDTIRQQNKLGDTPFFYFQGGFKQEKLSFLYKTMLNMVKKSIAKKSDKTQADIDMEQMLGTSFDCATQAQIQPLVESIGRAF